MSDELNEQLSKFRETLFQAQDACTLAKVNGAFGKGVTAKDLISFSENVQEFENEHNKNVSTDELVSLTEKSNPNIKNASDAFTQQDIQDFQSLVGIIPGYSEDDDIEVVCAKINQAVYSMEMYHPCPNVGIFQYDQRKCDPGYWCGCSDVKMAKCKPTNNTEETFWAGKYTETNFDPTTNRTTEKVYVGWGGNFPDEYFKCNNTLFCPGSSMMSAGKIRASPRDEMNCPMLCKQGYYCPNPTEKNICPVGSFCPTGSTEPVKCRDLERCTIEGSYMPYQEYYLLIVAVISLVAFGIILLQNQYLNKSWPFRKDDNDDDDNDDDDDDDDDVNEDNKAAANEDNEAVANGGKDLDDSFHSDFPSMVGTKKGSVSIVAPRKRLVRHSIANEKMELKLMRKQSVVTLPKPAYTIDVKFNDLQQTLKNGITICNGVTGELKGGQFTAIMGPSGAGKSTFLSLLSGKSEPTGGVLSVNGQIASLKDFREHVGFVPQEDIMLRELSVEENIKHSALMRLPSDLSYDKKMERVHQVMESLDLLHIRNSIIGDELVRGVSGGQRKRVNVAIELVADPSLLALDEPTSGLDSTTSYKLCETLSELACTGVNVAAVIHQPKLEILQKFTDVLLLGVGGKTVYIGSVEEMTPYFNGIGFPLPAKANPADFYMDVIAGLVPCQHDREFVKEDLFELWKESSYNPANKESNGKGSIVKRKAEHRVAPSFIGQTYYLFRRAVLQRFRVPRNTLIPLILSAGAAALIGYYTRTVPFIYYGLPIVAWDESMIWKASFEFMRFFPYPPISQLSNIWLFSALTIMLVCIVSLNTFGLEQSVCLRDSFSGTSAVSYWFAKSLEAGAWLPLYAGIYVTVQCSLNPLPIRVQHYWIVVWMSMVGFSGVGHIVSLIVGPTNRGIVHMICCLMLIMAFSGAMIKYNGNKFFTIFFTYWTAQGYVKDSSTPYEDVFEVSLYNEQRAKYDLDYSFGFNMICAMLTSLLWHFIALLILIHRMR